MSRFNRAHSCEVALGVTAAVLTGVAAGLGASANHDKMVKWLNEHAPRIVRCLHETADLKDYQILSEDSVAHTTKARINWSGTFGADRYTDVTITVSGDYSHPVATLAVLYDDGVMGPNDSCEYLRGVPMQ